MPSADETLPPRGEPTGFTRRSFLAGSTAGIGALAALLASCGEDDEAAPTGGSLDRKVIVVGAGPAGLTAAYRLRRAGVRIEVLEAGPTHGGRIRHDRDFADFPISLGGEWVHVDGSVLDEIVDDDAVDIETELVPYTDDDEVAYLDGGVFYAPLEPDVFDGDTKFRGSSWLDFFDTYVVPEIASSIRYDTQIIEIDHADDGVFLFDADGAEYEADLVVVTVPLRILQRRDIAFFPELEDDRIEAIDDAIVWSGLKAFFVFDEAFYPAAIATPDSATADGQRLFYDAAYGQDTDLNVLGLFSVGAQAERYQAMSDDELVADVLAELDGAFAGAASRSYVRHIVQNWNDEPFAGAAYLEDDAPTSISRRLAEPLGDRVYFAGDAYTRFDDWSSVHTAARSAIDAVDRMLR